jgi:hypothetical protein
MYPIKENPNKGLNKFQFIEAADILLSVMMGFFVKHKQELL